MPRSIHYQNILADLAGMQLLDLEKTVPPYQDNNTEEEKVDLVFRAIQKAKRTHQRTYQLLNAFYMGKLIEKDFDLKNRTKYKKQLSYHYQVVCSRIYYLFEYLGPSAILNMKRTSLDTIRKLKVEEFSELVNKVFIFSGTENF